jgi:hypothetical protein
MEAHEAPMGGHDMHGLVIGLHVTPAAGYAQPVVAERLTIRLLAQKKPNALYGYRTAYGFVLQQGDSAPARDSIRIPGPVLELRRGQPVRLLVKNTMDEYTGVHWHGLEIESFPDGVPNFSGMGAHIMRPIAPGDSFAAEFTPPRSGTFPYHSHLNELRQIGSGMYGAIIVTDAPRDTARDHLVVAGGGGVPMFDKFGPSFLLVNGRATPRAIHMTVGDTNRLRIVSIHSDEILRFRLGSDSTVARWTPLAKDGADLPPALRRTETATIEMGPGQTADFLYVPEHVGKMTLEVWISPAGQRIALPIEVRARAGAGGAGPASASEGSSEGAVARRGLVELERRSLGSEHGHSRLRDEARLVARDVRMLAPVEESLPRGSLDRRARRVVSLVEPHRSLRHEDEDGTGMTVPTARRACREGDRLDGDVERGLRLDLDVPVTRAPDREHRVFRVPERRAAEQLGRVAARRGSELGRRGLDGTRTAGRRVLALAARRGGGEEHERTSPAIGERRHLSLRSG